jgi:Protein of unknown function (DUF2889)
VLQPPHTGHGPHEPATTVPVRRAGGVRRTASTDMRSPAGLGGPLLLHGLARDVRTEADGGVTELAAAVLDIDVDRAGSPVVDRIDGLPGVAGLADLRGRPALSGWRAALAEVVPAEVLAATPLHLLLDDVPGAGIISGYAVAVDPRARLRADATRMPPADVCSGWRSDGTMMLTLRRDGAMPLLAGPRAPGLSGTDPLGWHPMPALRGGDMRRLRLMDVATDPADEAVLVVQAMFRDSHVDDDGDETVVHEYGLSARLARADLEVLAAVADPRVLPWQECPVAQASAGRIVGRRAGSLREHVRGTLTGTSTCTHLNDLLRTLDDVVALAAHLG